jgi:hypothetical protein
LKRNFFVGQRNQTKLKWSWCGMCYAHPKPCEPWINEPVR